MEITSVIVNKVKNSDLKFKGIATIVINDCLAIHDIRIIEGKNNGLFIAMPSKNTSIGEYRDVVHPVNQETRNLFTQCIIEEYKKGDKNE